MLELTRQIIILIPLCIVLPHILLYARIIDEGIYGIVVASPIADFCASLITVVFLTVELHKLLK